MNCKIVVTIALLVSSPAAVAKECWAITGLKGHMAVSTAKYAFGSDGFSNPMILCFNDDDSGSVTGDDTSFRRMGKSSLVGLALNKGIELLEAYQIDRVTGTVLFTKSRIGTATVIAGAPDVVGAFVGKATLLTE